MANIEEVPVKKRPTLKLKAPPVPDQVAEPDASREDAERLEREERARTAQAMRAELQDMLLKQPAMQKITLEDGREVLQPLAIKTHEKLGEWLSERFPATSKTQRLRVVSQLLRVHVRPTQYVLGLVHFSQRVHLDGTPAGEVSEKHREEAARRLKYRAEKNAARAKKSLKKDPA